LLGMLVSGYWTQDSCSKLLHCLLAHQQSHLLGILVSEEDPSILQTYIKYKSNMRYMYRQLKFHCGTDYQLELNINLVNISTRIHRTNRFNYDSHARLKLHQELPHLGFYHTIKLPSIHSRPVVLLMDH